MFIIGLGVLSWCFVLVVLVNCLSWSFVFVLDFFLFFRHGYLPCCFILVFTLGLVFWSRCIGLILSWSFVLGFCLGLLLGHFFGLLSWLFVLVFCLGLLFGSSVNYFDLICFS